MEYSSGGVILRTTLDNRRQALLIRIRKQGYELPKGHIERGETPSQAAHRECVEEVGILSTIEVGEKLEEITYSFSDGDKLIEKKVMYFLVRCTDEIKYKKPKATREVRWIEARELNTVQLISEDLRPIIAKAFQRNGQR